MEKKRSLKEVLKSKLTKIEFSKLIKSFDIVGDIAIIEIPEELERKEKEIAKALLDVHPHLKTVCKKAGIHEGRFRLRRLKIIAGEKKTETLYKEHGVLIRVDIEKVYFSPRLVYERDRIAKQVKPKEIIGAWFAGVGPYPLVIAKKQPRVGKIYAIELNPDAIPYLENNIRINKLSDKVVPLMGDVKKLILDLPKFDRRKSVV